MMDLVLKLRELRRASGLSQLDVARLSGIGSKTISSFETGQRIGTMKISQLERLLKVYDVTPHEFFSLQLQKRLDAWGDPAAEELLERVSEKLVDLPESLQRELTERFLHLVETAAQPSPAAQPRAAFRDDYSREWEMMTSRN
jgi:transcriptional regulator with XRE-family HTH domain